MATSPLELAFNHVVLPPKLPGQQDPVPVAVEEILLGLMVGASDELALSLPDSSLAGEALRELSRLRDVLNQTRHAHGDHLERSRIADCLKNIANGSDGVVLYVREQNAGLLIRRSSGDLDQKIIFEAFEASTPCADALSADALERNFPDTAASMSPDAFADQAFQTALSDFLEQASSERFHQFAAKIRKAGELVVEPRDPPDPALITQTLMPVVESLGQHETVELLRKAVRDDSVWKDAAVPWRRSPFWLILRVATQRLLSCHLDGPKGRIVYKFLFALATARLLDASQGQLTHDLSMLIMQKLCRRMAKLETDRQHDSGANKSLYDLLFGALKDRLLQSVSTVREGLERFWKYGREQRLRRVPRLPNWASDNDLRLKMPQSRPYLESVLSSIRMADSSREKAVVIPSDLDATKPPHLLKLLHPLTSCENRSSHLPGSDGSDVVTGGQVIALSDSLRQYIDDAMPHYKTFPDLMSLCILTALDLWVAMDSVALRLCPVLAQFTPVFKPGALEFLQLSSAKELEKLGAIQSYLQGRWKKCGDGALSIFADPAAGCFAQRYLQQDEDRHYILRLWEKITLTSERARQRKLSELEGLTQKYENHTQALQEYVCTCGVNPDGSKNYRGCTRCWHWRVRRRMKVQIHEDYLPRLGVALENNWEAAAIVFELAMPQWLSAYRESTWHILTTLASPNKPATWSPALKLAELSSLTQFYRARTAQIGLASEKKAFVQTHYSALSFPVGPKKVALQFGASFRYFAEDFQCSPSRVAELPVFIHLCGLSVPSDLGIPSQSLDGTGWPQGETPSSYQIVARQPRCPSQMSAHEYTSIQSILSATQRRWPTILRELGASNLNLSNEDMTRLLNQLILQAGPQDESCSQRRLMGWVFGDDHFCLQLQEQIDRRLDAISSSWRESNYMDTLVTLALRLFELGPTNSLSSHVALLTKARNITLDWINKLRLEVFDTEDTASTLKLAEFAMSAAMICRRTFEIYRKDGPGKPMESDDLAVYTKASIALQEHFITSLADLSDFQRHMMLRDLKLANRLRQVLAHATETYPDAFEEGIAWGWADSSPGARQFSPWRRRTNHIGWNKYWMESSTIATEETRSQVVHYNILDGRLLVDGKPLGQLPVEFTKSATVKRLFGSKHLRVMASPVPGMAYQLHILMDKFWQVHFGFRNDGVFIRARGELGTYEFVPDAVFRGPQRLDLPRILVDDCAHWLNLASRQLECRRMPKIWRLRDGDWSIDLRSMQASRRDVSLIDTFSHLFEQIASIFDGFVDASHLTVFQSKSTLHVEIKYLSLSFIVTRRGSLACKELRSLVDRNQDAGTFYGLTSMLVMCDWNNHSKRSLIVPLGNVRFKRHGLFTAVRVDNNGSYGQFGIDPVVGRLTCAPEPRLLYTKAQYHAYTSFILPDPLTGRTGSEEALHFLQSAICQPWRSLPPGSVPALKNIVAMSPRRTYYPPALEVMEKVEWNPDLPWWAQNDGYRPAVQSIFRKARDMAHFTHEKCPIDPEETLALRLRADLRRSRFGRSGFSGPAATRKVYKPRFLAGSARRGNARWIMDILNAEPFCINPSRPLSLHLAEWQWMTPVVADTQTSVTVTSLLNANLHEQWWTYVTCCAGMSRVDASFFLAVLSLKLEKDLLMILAAFSRFSDGQECAAALPNISLLVPFRCSDQPDGGILETLARNAAYSIGESAFSRARNHRLAWKDKAIYDDLCQADAHALAKELLEQWPCEKLSPPAFTPDTIRVGEAILAMEHEWSRAYQNHVLESYVRTIERRLAMCEGVPEQRNLEQTPIFLNSARDSSHDALSLPILAKANVAGTAFSGQKTWTASRRLENRVGRTEMTPDRRAAITKLQGLLQGLLSSDNELRKQYGHDLQASLQALREEVVPVPASALPTQAAAAVQEGYCESFLRDMKARVCVALVGSDPRAAWLQPAGLWPAMTLVSLLEQLRSIAKVKFGVGMKEALVEMGLAITALQRQRRIHDATLRQNMAKLQEELRDPGHVNWTPHEHPDWLLLEIDSDILIRTDQIEVAIATTSPESGKNSVLQMNMGRGKTSCIMPMAVAALANGSQICRLIVPKALLVQTAQTIQAKVGFLVGRELSHLPFSRQTKPSMADLDIYKSVHGRMLSSCGVMLTLPEHILSFKLSGIQALADCKETASAMIKFQDWISTKARDVLDESDFTLAVRTQLIYPSGAEIAVDGHPHRWHTIEVMLGLVASHVRTLQTEYPQGMQIVERDGGFPLVFFLQADAEDALMLRVVRDVVRGKTAIFRSATLGKATDSEALESIVYDKSVTINQCNTACSGLHNPAVAVKQLLLIRGLVQHRILILCLKKRWNVQYGLHPGRIPIAVPYEAKGIPSEQAEFGHADVAIILTCLSFYYSGVTVAQLRVGLQRVLNSDDPATEYDQWIGGSECLREELRHWNLVNTDDDGQVRELWKGLRRTKNVLDHFLNTFVFPVHAKQFSVKLQASGWDIPLFSTNCDGTTGGLTTGFSGTNDNRYLLPMTIRQHDLPSLHQTNAEVLTYLLENRNSGCLVAQDEMSNRASEAGLLHILKRKGIRVLIDAGALVLEMDNRALAEAWLEIDYGAQAALYFDQDRAMVKYRQGKDAVPLIATPFAENLEECLVYIDEVHTRGTDLKLPPNAQGAVTLGLGQTKDHTVQAAMRLRQLGTTQSIVFVAPPEVDQSIRSLCNISTSRDLQSADVVAWLLEQTCRHNEQMRPLYFAQGMDFCRRSNAVHQHPQRLGNRVAALSYIDSVFTPEHQSLEDLYCPSSQPNATLGAQSEFKTPVLADFAARLHQQQGELRAGDFAEIYGSAIEEVEQEREVEFQVEEVRENQKPPSYKPFKFRGLHSSIRTFVLEGTLDTSSNQGAYFELFETIGKTLLGQQSGVEKRSSMVFVSAEWLRTIHTKSGLNEGMLRPVEWILLNPTTNMALIVISEEAEQALALIRQTRPIPVTHLVVYSVPVTKHMSAFNRLQYFAHPPLPKHYTAPAALIADLGIIAGRLYFDFSEYEFLVRRLGSKAEGGEAILGDNGLGFLAEWLVLCRKGQDILHTPMGYICQGRPLQQNHPFFQGGGNAAGAIGARGGLGASDDKSSHDGVSDDDDDDDVVGDNDWMAVQEEDIREVEEGLRGLGFGSGESGEVGQSGDGGGGGGNNDGSGSASVDGDDESSGPSVLPESSTSSGSNASLSVWNEKFWV